MIIENNPLECDCSLQHLVLKNVKYNKGHQFLNIHCFKEKIEIEEFITDNCTHSSSSELLVIALLASFVSIISIITLLIYVYQTEIRIFLFSHNLCTWLISMDRLDANKKYDAFLSYCYKDEDFVLNEIVQKIENDPRNFKVCIHVRDWEAGEWIQNNILKSVEESRRTLIVLSKNFIKSKWGLMEFRTVHTQMIREGITRVIIILYGDIGPIDDLDSELKSYLKTNTYIKWGEQHFWRKLFYALYCANKELPARRL